MIIYIDENLPHQLAEGLDKLQQPLNSRNGIKIFVKSIKSEFYQGVKDEEWIPIVGNQESIAITRDIKIQRTRHQKELCKEYGIGIFFFSVPRGGMQYWQIVESIVDKWEKIQSISLKESKPFAYRFTPRSSKMEKLEE